MANVSICGLTGYFKGSSTRHQEPVGALGPRCRGETPWGGDECIESRIFLFRSSALDQLHM